jgi:15-cis-phytoene synthase
MELAAAYEACEEITRLEARNFSYGIRLLPDDKRKAMSALYAFARRVDDIGDGTLPVAEKRAALEAVRERTRGLATGAIDIEDPISVALGDAVKRYPIAADELVEVVDGCEMDCSTSSYSSFDDLATYCRLVAGSIGRLSLSIFGSSDAAAPRLADTLGLGLQLTNILRDVVEDRDVMGRVYLPVDDLARFSCSPDVAGDPDHLAELLRFEAGRARAFYAEGLDLLDLLDRRSRACVSAMSGIYLRLLRRIEANPLAVLERRVSLPGWEKAWVALRSLAGAGA